MAEGSNAQISEYEDLTVRMESIESFVPVLLKTARDILFFHFCYGVLTLFLSYSKCPTVSYCQMMNRNPKLNSENEAVGVAFEWNVAKALAVVRTAL